MSPADKRFYTVLAVIAVVLIAWWAEQFLPEPLGDRLEYIGKRGYGCYAFCDATPGSTYFYATNMSTDELIKYFKKASFHEQQQKSDWEENGQSYNLYFNGSKDTSFSLSFYDYGSVHSQQYGFGELKRKHLVKIDAHSYSAAKDSL